MSTSMYVLANEDVSEFLACDGTTRAVGQFMLFGVPFNDHTELFCSHSGEDDVLESAIEQGVIDPSERDKWHEVEIPIHAPYRKFLRSVIQHHKTYFPDSAWSAYKELSTNCGEAEKWLRLCQIYQAIFVAERTNTDMADLFKFMTSDSLKGSDEKHDFYDTEDSVPEGEYALPVYVVLSFMFNEIASKYNAIILGDHASPAQWVIGTRDLEVFIAEDRICNVDEVARGSVELNHYNIVVEDFVPFPMLFDYCDLKWTKPAYDWVFYAVDTALFKALCHIEKLKR